MTKINKVLCELDKRERKALWEELLRKVRHPRFVCRKCARVCATKGLLCKPLRL